MTDEIAALTYVKKIAHLSEKEDIDEIVRVKLGSPQGSGRNCGFIRITRRFLLSIFKEDVRNNIHAGMINKMSIILFAFDRTSGSAGDTVPYAYLGDFIDTPDGFSVSDQFRLEMEGQVLCVYDSALFKGQM